MNLARRDTRAVPFAAARAIERQAHRLLVRSCVRNEWFETTPAAAIEAVHSAAEPWMKAPPVPASQTALWPRPSEWRISRAHRPSVPPTTTPPLTQKARERTPLPLFDFYHATKSTSPNLAPETPIERLAGFRLEISCCSGSTSYPLGLMASSLPQGGRTSLSAAIGLFRCERCRQPAREAVLVEHDETKSAPAWKVEVGHRGH